VPRLWRFLVLFSPSQSQITAVRTEDRTRQSATPTGRGTWVEVTQDETDLQMTGIRAGLGIQDCGYTDDRTQNHTDRIARASQVEFRAVSAIR